jgi:hypothetical protein
MSAAPPSEISSAVLVLLLFVAIIARRTYRMIQGTRYSPGRLFGFAGFYVLLFAGLAFTTLFAAVSAWGLYGELLVIPYAAVPAAAGVVAAPYVRRIVRFERRDDGRWYYRLPWLVPILYLSLFIFRFSLEIVLFGVAFTSSFLLPTSVPTGWLLLLMGVDLLFGISLGVLLGRSVGVYRAFQDLPQEPGSSEAPPLPSNPSP